MNYEDKIKKSIMEDIRLKRIPQRSNIPHPVFYKCGRCKKRLVTDHHYLCNKCWKEKYSQKKIELKGGI